MKVKDLVELLQKQDPEAEVFTEGCDCIGDVADVEHCVRFFHPSKGHTNNIDIILTRSK